MDVLGALNCTDQARLVAGLHEGKAVGIVYLDFSRAFPAVFHSILLGKSWQPTDWTDGQFTGLETGWMVRRGVVVNGAVFRQSLVVSSPEAWPAGYLSG